jgi:hypothetical protein
VTTSVRREAAPGRGKEGCGDSWVDANFTGPKNEKKTHAVDSITTNGRWRFKSTMGYFCFEDMQMGYSFVHLIA